MSITKLATALVAAQKEMTSALKDAKNPFFKSKYADLNSVREACMPALNKHGIAVLQPTVVVDGKNYVQTLLLHESGESLTSLTEIKVSKINDAQAEGSGISYARRYGLQTFVNIGAEDDDGEKSMDRTKKSETQTNSVPVAAKPAYVTKTPTLATPAVTLPSAPPAVGSATASSFKKATPAKVAAPVVAATTPANNEDWG